MQWAFSGFFDSSSLRTAQAGSLEVAQNDSGQVECEPVEYLSIY